MLFFGRRRQAEGVLGDDPRPWTSCLFQGTVYLMPGSDQHGARDGVLRDNASERNPKPRRTIKNTLGTHVVQSVVMSAGVTAGGHCGSERETFQTKRALSL